MSTITTIQHTLTTSTALSLCQAAIDYAEQIEITICVSVVCLSGRTLASANMNHAPILSHSIANRKAITAASFQLPTKEWQSRLAERTPILMALQSEPDFTYIGGGLPISIDNEIVAAIGISGGSEQQDIDCATAALQSITNLLQD
ncbi:GlcG/HbpS family heme-binding protein [Marinomonas algarum]|uniref:Heme-binding protein n=1 Tax=Marinomonas algarum TaxID=2883105 RepID=A0A9X1IMF5_9GAMM|nr:heme-binding protein [Marinomonas algarum]MCB5161001.1 heme-binding protein [Marinomonas algarum]